MKKEEKATIIDQLQELFAKANVGVLTNYRGMKTSDLLEIRKRLKNAGGKYEIVKNTLARFAAEKAGITQLEPLFNETTAIAFGFKEPKDLALAVTEYTRTTKTVMVIKGGFLGNRLLSTADVTRLTTLPSRDILIAQLMGQLQSPIAMLMAQLNAPISGLVNVLNERKKQIEGGSN
jgi:large subunit ribosomal protein L10